MLNSFIEQFISYLEIVRNFSINTLYNYKRDLNKLEIFLTKNKINSPESIKEHHIRDFINK